MSKIYSSISLFSEAILRGSAFLAIALFIFMLATQKASAAAITVNSLNDTVAAGDGCTLREAIINANSDNQSGSTDCAAGAGTDTISITVAGTINLLTALPGLLTDMTITGLGANNTTVRRGATTEFRIFTINSGISTISGMTIRDGIASGANFSENIGGGIFNQGGALALSNVVVTNNRAIGDRSNGISNGGGIATFNQLTIINSTFSDNTATSGDGSTGCVQAVGGAMSISTGEGPVVTITNTVVSGNRALCGTGTNTGGRASGGGIAAGGGVNITFNNSTVIGNSVVGGNNEGFGGGILFDSSSTIAVINNSIITGNTSTNRGGGIFVDSSNVNLTRSTVSGNTASGNSTSGGIDNQSGALNVTNSTISGNFTNGGIGGNGGGIKHNSFRTTTLTNVTVTNNTAFGQNSASGVLKNNGTVNVKNTIIAANVNNTITPDTSGVFASQGYNLIGNIGIATGFTATGDQSGTTVALDPRLAPLADNGGATQTHALLASSPAIDKGAAAIDPITAITITTDQRGFPRPVDLPDSTYPNAAGGDGSDIGAYEAQTAPAGTTAATVSISGRVTTQSGNGITNVRLSLTDSQGNVRTATTTTGGYYRFSDVEVGSTYIVTATGKRFSFSQSSQVVNVNDETAEINFIANSEKRLRAF